MSDSRGERRVVELLTVPLEAYDVVTVLGLDAYPPLMARLTPVCRAEMALTVVRAVLKGDTKVRCHAGLSCACHDVAACMCSQPQTHRWGL